MTITTASVETAPQRNGKRRPLIAFSLAALAIGGIGAAATSAAWTDNTLFSASAAAATFDLQGSVDGTTWAQSSAAGSVELVVPASTFANLLPGQSRQVTLHVKNVGTVGAALTSTVAFAGSTFETAPVATVTGLASTLTANGSDDFVLSVTAPADWSPANQGKSGTVVITVAGEAIAG